MQPQSWQVTFVCVGHGFDVDTASQVRTELLPLLLRQGHVVLDLRDAVLDSSGLGAVLSLQRRLELQNRKLMVVATDPQFLALLERAGVAGVLSLFNDAEQAVRHARALPTLGMAA